MNSNDYLVIFVAVFIVVVIGMLAIALIAEWLTPVWQRLIEGQWYSSINISPSVKTVSRDDTAKLYQAMRLVKSKMIREGRHILSVKQGKKS